MEKIDKNLKNVEKKVGNMINSTTTQNKSKSPQSKSKTYSPIKNTSNMQEYISNKPSQILCDIIKI